MSAMYNSHPHRMAAGTTRFTEILEQMRAEYESQMARIGDYEMKINNQVQEMEMIRNSVYALETTHSNMKASYEEEITRLKRELEARGGGAHVSHVAQGSGPSQPPAPQLGTSSKIFTGIMSGEGGQGGPGMALTDPQQSQSQAAPVQVPPASQQQPGAQPTQPLQPAHGQNHPHPHSHSHSHPPPPSVSQQSHPQTSPNQPPQGQQFQQPSFANGYNQPPPPTASPGPPSGRKRPGPGPGPATPVQQNAQGYQETRPSPQVSRPSPAPTGNNLSDFDPERIPANYKKEGNDWFAYFNPRVSRVLDVDLVHTLDHNSVVCCVRFSQDGKYVATGCNRSAQIFDVQSGKKVTVLQDESVDREGDLYIRSVCFSPDGRYLATGAEDKQIRVWDIQARTIKHNFVGHEQDIYSLDFSRNGRHIASGSGDRTVRLWDMETGVQIVTLAIEDGVTTVAISPDGRFVAAGSLDKSVRVWEAATGLLVERLEGPDGHKDSVYSVAFAPNGRDLVSGSLDRTIKMWELSAARGLPSGPKGGNCVKTFEGHRDFVLSVALTPDGNWVLSGSKDRGVQFWDPRTANTQLMLQGHKNSVISVAPSPTGRLFATGSGDMRARIWSYEPYHA